MARSSSFSSGSSKARQKQISYNTYKSNKALNRQLRNAEKNEPVYRDNYANYKNAIVNSLQGGGSFMFDPVSNPVYQGYSQDYRLLGAIAADQSAANIEGLSGGYGSTYSGTVAQQGLESHLANEKAILPALMQQERANYLADRSNLINQGNLYNALEGQDFAQYQTRRQLWDANREYAYNKMLNDYQQSAVQHNKATGTENSSETSSRVTVTAPRRSSSSSKVSRIKDQAGATQYLISKGYGNQLDDMLTRQEYVTQRARQDRDYNAGYTGLSKSDEDYATKKAAEDKVDADYSNYLYTYIQKKLKGKK